MKKTFIALFLLAALLPADSKPIKFTLGNWLWKPASDQALLTTSSPTFAGLTLSGGTASTLVYLNASKKFTSLANGAGYLLNDGSGGLSWAAVSLSGYLKADGTVPLTAAWDAGEYGITAINLTADPTLSAEQLTNVAGWTPAGNWSYASSKWSHATGNATALTATGETAIVAGTKYEITMTIATTTAGGGLAVSLGGQSFAAVSTTGSYTFNVTAPSTAALAITPTSGTWVGDITAISVKILTANTGILTADGISLNSGQLLLPNGNPTYPALSFARDTDTGFWWRGSGQIAYTGDGSNQIYFGGANALWINGSISLNLAGTMILGADSAAVLQLGADAAAPVDQTIKAADGTGTDKPGAMLTQQGGASTGTGAPGGWSVQTSTVAGTGSTANTYYDRIRAVGKVYSISNNSATALFSLAVADGVGVGGKVDYTIEVTDGTDIQVESGTVHFAAVNKATETWTSGTPAEVSLQALSGGTLATTWAADTATADTFKLTLNSNSSLTPTSTLVRIVITLNSPRAITIL
jgi:hypothetical protein